MINYRFISLVVGIAVALIIMLTVWSNRHISEVRQKEPDHHTSPFYFLPQPKATLNRIVPFIKSGKYATYSRWIDHLLSTLGFAGN